MKLHLTDGARGENVGNACVRMENESPELGHLDERESDAVMFNRTEHREASFEELAFFLALNLWDCDHVRLFFRRLFPREDIEGDVGIISCHFENPRPSEKIFSAVGNIGQNLVPSFNWSGLIGFGRNRPDKAYLQSRKLMSFLNQIRSICQMNPSRLKRIGISSLNKREMLQQIGPNPQGHVFCVVCASHPLETSLETANPD